MSTPIEAFMGKLNTKQQVDFACWLANSTEYGQQELVDWYEDILNGVSSYNILFRHTPVRSFSSVSTKLFAVSCKGKTKEEAIASYKKSFDKERWKSVEVVE